MNIWQITEYTLAVSIVALLLLLMKRLFHDKLDARWHYFIWAVLFVRMTVPLELTWLKSPMSLFKAIPIHYLTQLLQLKADRADIARMIDMLLPWYLAGAALFLIYYIVVAIMVRVRTLLLAPAESEVYRHVSEVAAAHGLKPCSRIRIHPAGQTYVCGLIRPVLVLPSGDVADEVILHELLHRKYADVLINYLLHLMRAVQWFNPLIWYVTAVILNDSEALCDQRVLEYMQLDRMQPSPAAPTDGSDPPSASGDAEPPALSPFSCEKIYGSLLLQMAEQKPSSGISGHKAKVGTTNMANSYRNMQTRIRRIADFKRVPAGAGFAALCITVILSVSVIAYGVETRLISSGIESEQDLDSVILRGLTYQAQTPEEALYLYIKALCDMNPIYLLPVMPSEELPAYEQWIRSMYDEEKFLQYHENGHIYVGGSGSSIRPGSDPWLSMDTDIIENPWFTADGSDMRSCSIYDLPPALTVDEAPSSQDASPTADSVQDTSPSAGSAQDASPSAAAVAAWFLIPEEDAHTYILRTLQPIYEKGWKIKLLSQSTSSEEPEPEALLYTEASQGDWHITVRGWNEGSFPEIFQTVSGMQYYTGTPPTARQLEETAVYPTAFTMSWKHIRAEATYLGEILPDAEQITIKTKVYDDAAWLQAAEDPFFTEMGGRTKAELDRLAGVTDSDMKDTSHRITALGDFSSSDGSSVRQIQGAEIQPGQPILLSGHGGGYDSWDGTEELHFMVQIFYDGELTETIVK